VCRGQQAAGQAYEGDGSGRRTAAQLDLDVQALSQPCDHGQTHAAGRLAGQRSGVPQQVVVALQEVVGDADAVVVDLNGHGVDRPMRRHDDFAARRREHDGVLQQLGHQVHEVADGVRVDPRLLDGGHLDAGVLLDLRGGCHHQVGHQLRLRERPPRVGARQDEQVLLVTPHAGGQMVEQEQPVQRLGIGLGLLELVDQHELPLDEGLAAA
jgi:hypothetical protein